jgi:hypothetical protein
VQNAGRGKGLDDGHDGSEPGARDAEAAVMGGGMGYVRKQDLEGGRVQGEEGVGS